MDSSVNVGITLDEVSKTYPGPDGGTTAVHALSMQIPAGQLVALVGPSGCGKTTTLKMINRLIEPTSGRILLGEDDVTEVNPVQLRRRIGYVIQNVGLFPHLSVEANVATVPRLLGWDKKRQHDAGDRAAGARRPRPEDVRQALPGVSFPAVSASGSGSPARSGPTRRCC